MTDSQSVQSASSVEDPLTASLISEANRQLMEHKTHEALRRRIGEQDTPQLPNMDGLMKRLIKDSCRG